MKKIIATLKISTLITMLFFSAQFSNAQVGINTATPDPSSMLDVSATDKGMLTPRMTTIQKNAIATPANGLLVFDTTEKGFYYYDSTTSSWIRLASENKRNNYKLIKSVADLAAESIAGGASKYLLDTKTFYEINGTINLVKPIDLNDAYVAGLDANEDVLSFTGGTVFQGSAGGSIKNVTLKGAQAFNITGPGIATNSSLLIQNTIIDGMTTGVGSISGLGLYYGGVVQFINNTDGITYSNIGNCLLDNQAWSSSNNGTFEKFTGTFGLIEKGSGFSTVNGADVAFDVSDTGLTVGTGTLEGTVFSGTSSAAPGYIKGYDILLTYTGYNFSNVWYVDSPGIPREGDAVATGDINLDAAVGTGFQTVFGAGTGSSTRKKIAGTTTSNSLYRFTKDGDNRITYRGKKPRYFQVSASVSYQGNSDLTVILYIAKNGAVLTETKVYGKGTTGFLTSAGILALPLVGTLQLKKDDYIEIWAERYDGGGNMQTISLNLTAR